MEPWPDPVTDFGAVLDDQMGGHPQEAYRRAPYSTTTP